MPLQMRIYKIKETQLETFAREWATQIKPLREKLGFAISKAYMNHEVSEFIWFLEHPDEDWKALDEAYHTSTERRAMNPNPARNIVSTKQWFLEELS